MQTYAERQCTPCRGDAPPLGREAIDSYLKELSGWELDNSGTFPKLVKRYRFENFADALEFTRRVGNLAEEQDHHPRITTEWGKVKLSWWTHKIEGLHDNDFIMAAKSDRLYGEFSRKS
jgi:4a-hydroxytetrahydrobiopterin dehydratase